MNKRIKMVRKSAGVSQEIFAKSLGLSRIHIAQVETGQSVFSDRAIRDICRIYKVNEEWLRTGIGEMHPPLSDNEQIASFLNDVMECDNDEIKRKLILGLSQLSDDDWIAIDQLAKKLLDN